VFSKLSPPITSAQADEDPAAQQVPQLNVTAPDAAYDIRHDFDGQTPTRLCGCGYARPVQTVSRNLCSFEKETHMRKTLAACSIGASAAILIIGLLIA
jgi:hypothetical protein